MIDKLFGGVHCHPSELIWREEEEEVVQARKNLPLLTYRCKLTNNGSPQEPLLEWMSTIDVLFNTIIFLKPFLPRQSAFSPVECDLVVGIYPVERRCDDGVCGAGMLGNGGGGRGTGRI